MELRSLAVSGGVVATAAHTPFIVAFAVAGHPDVVRGLLLGLVVGMLNSFLLARKLDRTLGGREPWQGLSKTMPRNMLARFALIIVIVVAASRANGINVAALACGIALYFIVSLVYMSRAIATRWKKEDGTPVYG